MKPGFIVLTCLLAGSFALASAQDTSQQPAPDNTKVNQRDRNPAESTADQQKENTSDRELTRQVRKAITDDKSVSTYAHNVKIISQNGSVTLKGPVRSEEEKNAIEAKAASVVGSKEKVINQLEVKPEKQ